MKKIKIKIISVLLIIILISTPVVNAFSSVAGELSHGGNAAPSVPPTPSDSGGSPPASSSPPPESSEPAPEPPPTIIINCEVNGKVFEDYKSIVSTKEIGATTSSAYVDLMPSVSANSSIISADYAVTTNKSVINQGDEPVGTKILSTDGVKQDYEPAIAGHKVKLLDGDKNETGIERIIGEDGKFVFTNGEYTGDLYLKFEPNSNLVAGDYAGNRSKLKYNAEDYTTLQVGKSQKTVINSFERKIINAKEGYSQVYLVLDYSVSMMDTEIEGVPKVEVVKSAAKNLIHSLFAKSDDNLAIGVLVYAGEAVILKRPTDIEDELIEAIDGFKVSFSTAEIDGTVISESSSPYGYYTYIKDGTTTTVTIPTWSNINQPGSNGTNIAKAVTKANENFWGEFESTRSIMLLTDGMPTIYGYTPTEAQEYVVYVEDLANHDVAMQKFEKIAKATNDDLRAVVDTGTNLINISAKLDDPDEIHCAEMTFRYDYGAGDYIGKYYTIDDTIESITETIETEVLKDLSYEERGSTNTNYQEWSAGENEEKRNEFKEKYKYISNQNIEIFQVIDNLTGTAQDEDIVREIMGISYNEFIALDEVKQLIEDSDMELLAGPFHLDPESSPPGYIVIHTKNENEDIIFTKREDFGISVSQKVSGVRVSLSDGTILYENYSEGALDTLNKMLETEEGYQLLAKVDEVSNFPGKVRYEYDSDIVHGATIEVEYTTTIKNKASMPTESFAFVSYYDSSLTYDANSKLLTEDSINSDYFWNDINTTDFVSSGFVTKQAAEKIGKEGRGCLIAQYYKEAYQYLKDNGIDSKYIDPSMGYNSERYVKVVLKQVLTPEILKDFNKKNEVEILQYSNPGSRRVAFTETDKIKELFETYGQADMLNTTEKVNEFRNLYEKLYTKNYPGNYILGTKVPDSESAFIAYNNSLTTTVGSTLTSLLSSDTLAYNPAKEQDVGVSAVVNLAVPTGKREE